MEELSEKQANVAVVYRYLALYGPHSGWFDGTSNGVGTEAPRINKPFLHIAERRVFTTLGCRFF